MTGETRMKPAEVLAEMEWLLSFGTTPLLVSEALGRTPDSLARVARRAGRLDLAGRFEALASIQRREKNPGADAEEQRTRAARRKVAA